ncbi:MAG TPA: KEOPS complex kinase/ATPase Bud32 [Alphaproteobacteria bacterium]|nr:KEOPS complex kinase/ATPase Bud32 [Alphaproteobacteria bacterium]
MGKVGKSIIGSGAEAIISKDSKIVTKDRIKKGYRHESIDSGLRKSRTNKEVKILKALETSGFVPRIMGVENNLIKMDFIDGIQLKKILDRDPKLAKLIGKNLAIMHDLNIIHGDLTTSNMILSGKGKNRKLFFIDFGLSFVNPRVEDKAVDIHVFKQALESKHYKIYNKAYSEFIKGYNPKNKKEVLERLNTVEQRGRYKEKT